MESKHETPYFLSQHKGLIESTVADEFLHPPTADTPGDSLTETQYFGLCIPEQRIHGLFYCWRHPNLRIVTGGVWIFQGMKLEPLSCELFDWHDFMSDRVLSDDFRNFKLLNSYSVTVLEPLKRHRLSYSDPSRGNAFNLEYEALAPPASWAKGLHFDQAMKVRGELSLAGKKYGVNCYNVRDRSWGKLRPEEHNRVPPIVWMTGVFSDNFFFNCTAFDHPDLDPDWQGLFPDITADRTLVKSAMATAKRCSFMTISGQ